MVAEVNKISSTEAALILAEESSIGTLPATPVYFEVPVVSYDSGTGVTLTLESERLISERRRRRGAITAEDVAGGFLVNFKPTILYKLIPWIMLSNFNANPAKGTVFDSTGLAATADSFDTGADAATAGWQVGHLVYAENFALTANNGLKTVTAIDGDEIDVSGNSAEATPPDTAVIRAVGIQFGTGELQVAKTAGSFPTLVIASGSLVWTNFNVQPGSWIYIGGSDTVDQYDTVGNNGYARVLSVSSDTLTLDRAPGGTNGTTDMTTETAATKTIQVFLSDFIKDQSSESADDFNALSYFMERRLGVPNPDTAPTVIQTEEFQGAINSTATFGIAKRTKSTVNFAFLAIGSDEHTGVSGDERTTDGETILEVEDSEFFNNSSDVIRSIVSIKPTDGDGAPDPLVGFVDEFGLQLSNNAEVQTAVGAAAGFDINTNGLTADIDIPTYFAEIAARKSIRANDEIQFEIAWQRQFNSREIAVLMDFPACSIGGGAVDPQIDTSMRQPIRLEAAESSDHDLTMSYNHFWYIP